MELGIALGLDRPVLIVAGYTSDFGNAQGRQCAFYALPGVRKIVEPDEARRVERVVRALGRTAQAHVAVSRVASRAP